MRVTLTLDDALIERARVATGIDDLSELLHEALKALIERQAIKDRIAMSGTMPEATAAPRRRMD